jgi:hypothetical protein
MRVIVFSTKNEYLPKIYEYCNENKLIIDHNYKDINSILRYHQKGDVVIVYNMLDIGTKLEDFNKFKLTLVLNDCTIIVVDIKQTLNYDSEYYSYTNLGHIIHYNNTYTEIEDYHSDSERNQIARCILKHPRLELSVETKQELIKFMSKYCKDS